LITKNENKNQLLPHLSQSLGTDFKLLATRPIKSSLKFKVQSQTTKKKNHLLPHLSQALGTDFKLSATRPIKNSLRFEVIHKE
jgi:hypothetical protein